MATQILKPGMAGATRTERNANLKNMVISARCPSGRAGSENLARCPNQFVRCEQSLIRHDNALLSASGRATMSVLDRNQMPCGSDLDFCASIERATLPAYIRGPERHFASRLQSGLNPQRKSGRFWEARSQSELLSARDMSRMKNASADPGTGNVTIYRRSAADSALIDWVMVSAGWTRG